MEFDSRVVARFFGMLRELHRGAIVCEPRHESWFGIRADDLLRNHSISRVVADPRMVAVGSEPGGANNRLVYFRLHGSPRTYWSSYSRDALLAWAMQVRQRSSKIASWVIFDNTAAGCATSNALDLRHLLMDAED